MIPTICVHRLRCLNKRLGTPLSSLLGGALSLNLLETSPKKESEKLGTARERRRERGSERGINITQRGTRYLKHRKKKHKETGSRRDSVMSEQVRLTCFGGGVTLCGSFPVFPVGTDLVRCLYFGTPLNKSAASAAGPHPWNDLLVCFSLSVADSTGDE